ncbi:MAG: hypothetical protein SVR94_14900 [Pseudomonadota bacterium]|nr:hypothetical protein [Pseudomonadota bacterium]
MDNAFINTVLEGDCWAVMKTLPENLISACITDPLCKPEATILVFNSNRTVAHVQIALEKAGFYARDMMVYRRSRYSKTTQFNEKTGGNLCSKR